MGSPINREIMKKINDTAAKRKKYFHRCALDYGKDTNACDTQTNMAGFRKTVSLTLLTHVDIIRQPGSSFLAVFKKGRPEVRLLSSGTVGSSGTVWSSSLALPKMGTHERHDDLATSNSTSYEPTI